MDITRSVHPRWWLSTRTHPDLAFAVSSTAQVLTKDLELLKLKLRHILQYRNTTKRRDCFTFILLVGISLNILFLEIPPLLLLVVVPNPGLLSIYPLERFATSFIVQESSAESELYALASARKAARNFSLLIRESFTTSVIMSLRCDNTVAISMLEDRQLADPLTKPTSALINSLIFPQWGLATYNGG